MSRKITLLPPIVEDYRGKRLPNPQYLFKDLQSTTNIL